MPSNAFTLFHRTRATEVREIISIFRNINNRLGPNTNYSLLNGALVLLVSSWEIYCEDVCQQTADTIKNRDRLTFSDLSAKSRKDLVTYAGANYKGGQDPLLEKIAMLPDQGWKTLLADRLTEYIRDFNTPKFTRRNGKDLNGLFRAALGIKISPSLSDFLEDEDFCQNIDNVITLRGEIAHTGDAAPENRLSADILETHTKSFIEAAASIDVIIHREFRNQFGFAPWQITAPIRTSLREVARAKL